jgi:hypothetical protein
MLKKERLEEKKVFIHDFIIFNRAEKNENKF